MNERDPKAMIYEKNRLLTYSQWIYKNEKNVKCTAEKMAKAGFYVISESEPGSVKCFVCMKPLDGWERDDDPFEEHRKHAPLCPFVKLDKEENDITIEEFLNLCEEMDCNLLDQLMQDQVKKLEELRESCINRLKKAEGRKKK